MTGLWTVGDDPNRGELLGFAGESAFAESRIMGARIERHGAGWGGCRLSNSVEDYCLYWRSGLEWL